MYHHLCLFCLLAVGIDFESRMWRLTFKRRYSDIIHSKLRKNALEETKNSKSNVLNRLSIIFNIKRKHMIGAVNINYLLRLLEFVLAITLFEYMMHCYGIIPVSSWHNIISCMLSKAIQKVFILQIIHWTTILITQTIQDFWNKPMSDAGPPSWTSLGSR